MGGQVVAVGQREGPGWWVCASEGRAGQAGGALRGEDTAQSAVTGGPPWGQWPPVDGGTWGNALE